jgi:hypothetical protein
MTNEPQDQNESNHSDHRYFPRWEVKSKAHFRLGQNPKNYEAFTQDLSCSGACLWTDELIEERQPIVLTLYLPDGHKVKLEGNVLWYKRKNNKTQLGVSFHNIPEEAADTILDYAFNVDPHAYHKHFFDGWDDVQPNPSPL